MINSQAKAEAARDIAQERGGIEALLGAFQGIHLSIVTLGQQFHRHLTPSSALQQRILSLLDLSSDLYDQLRAEFPKPP